LGADVEFDADFFARTDKDIKELAAHIAKINIQIDPESQKEPRGGY